MALPTYSTGTASVAAGGTVVTGAGCSWTGVNAKQGDFISIGGSDAALITEVTDATHLKVAPWTAGAKTSQTYIIYQNYVGRVVGVAAAEDVGDMLEKLHVDGLPFIVDPADTVPDPSYGDDGQFAFQPTTGKWWTKTGGAWVLSPGLTSDSTKVLKAGDTMTGNLNINASLLLNGTTVLNSASDHTQLLSIPGNAAFIVGGTTDPVNYYRNASHKFQNIAGSQTYCTMAANGASFGNVAGPWNASTPLCAETTAASAWTIGSKALDRGILYLMTGGSGGIYGYFCQGTTSNNVGQIAGTTTTTTYATTSDGRRKPLRENFSGIDIINALNPVRHNWSNEPGQWSYGCIAQEAVDVLPQMIIRGDNDPNLRPGDDGFVQWGADYSQAVPVLIRAVQELLLRIEALEASP